MVLLPISVGAHHLLTLRWGFITFLGMYLVLATPNSIFNCRQADHLLFGQFFVKLLLRKRRRQKNVQQGTFGLVQLLFARDK